MSPEHQSRSASIPPLGNEDALDGALELLRRYRIQIVALAAEIERREMTIDQAIDTSRRVQSTLGFRLQRAYRKVRRQGWRLHRYLPTLLRELRRPPELPSRPKYPAKYLTRLPDLAELERLTKRRHYGEAVALAASMEADFDRDRAFLIQARRTYSRAGALTLSARAIRALRDISDTPGLALEDASASGRLRETEPHWRPVVNGELEPLVPDSQHRVLHLLKASIPHRQSGYTMRSKYTVDAQRDVGLDPVVMTALDFPRAIGITEFESDEVINGSRYVRLDRGEGASALAYDGYLSAYAEAAAEHVRRLNPAVIHVHSGHRGFDAAVVGLALGRHFDIPVVYEVRGFFEGMWTADAEWAERGEHFLRRVAIENSCMAEADAVVTLSTSMRTEIFSRGIDVEKIHVVPNGVDTDAFQPRRRRSDLVGRYGLHGRFTFGYVSNLDHSREGHETLIEAAGLLRKAGLDATALIVGDGRRRSELEKLAAAQGAGDAVVFTGRVPHDEVLDYYALLDAFVIPRVPERAARLVTPLKPFEAMAAGVPLVVSDLEALREIAGDGDRGRIFDPGNANSLARILLDLSRDEPARKALAAKARQWVIDERQWRSNGARYAALYADLVRGRRPQPR